ncbi:hypothetical protein [Ancylomarina longa]|uniref:DUF5056 domain-containing protein n=1 Tax=Ancylomarina longa TaxID=2487017 RepID=A0A434AFB6_9BACT|nr:hypothetical protein [Ancylomarina longa]RUT73077.1 hypothetical protein DLK05_15210 [Ancylomarina longa]
MNKKLDFYKDEFVKDLFGEIKPEEPSNQFTNRVMDRVMQDWLANPIEVKKPISRTQWLISSGLIFLVCMILLATDVRTLISNIDHPFFNQLDAVLLQPLHHILNKVFISLINLPIIVYVILIAIASLAAFDRIITKLLQFRHY